jgi:hypothetical protein
MWADRLHTLDNDENDEMVARPTAYRESFVLVLFGDLAIQLLREPRLRCAHFLMIGTFPHRKI